MVRSWLALLAAGAALVAASSDDSTGGSIDASLFAAEGKVDGGLRFEQVVPASPTAVFDAWTTPEGVRAFLEADARIELRIGGAYELYFAPEEAEGLRGSEGCQILSYVPDRMLSFSWNAPPAFPAERAARSWIVMTFEPLEDGRRTRVRVEHLGFGTGGSWAQVKQTFRRAWPRTLDSLARHFGR